MPTAEHGVAGKSDQDVGLPEYPQYEMSEDAAGTAICTCLVLSGVSCPNGRTRCRCRNVCESFLHYSETAERSSKKHRRSYKTCARIQPNILNF